MSGSLDIILKKNNDKSINFIVQDKLKNRIDMTGFSVKWVLRKTLGSTALITKGTSDGSVNMASASTGKFTVIIDAADTLSLPAGQYFHEAVLTNLQGKHINLTDYGYEIGTCRLVEQYTAQ